MHPRFSFHYPTKILCAAPENPGNGLQGSGLIECKIECFTYVQILYNYNLKDIRFFHHHNYVDAYFLGSILKKKSPSADNFVAHIRQIDAQATETIVSRDIVLVKATNDRVLFVPMLQSTSNV